MRFVVVIQSVGTQQSYDGLVFHLRLGNIGKINAGGITLELHIQAKLLALHPTGQLVHVLHHQPPVALSWIVAGVFERLDEQRRIYISNVTGKLAHLIGGTTVSIFVRHGQHLVGLQSHAQRDVTQCRVNRVFRGIQQARAFQLLIVHTAHKSAPIEHRCRLVDVACRRKLAHQRAIFGIRIVGGNHLSRGVPQSIGDVFVLAQVGQCDDVTGVCGDTRIVGDPDFHPINLHTRCQIGQRLHVVIVRLTKIL